MSGKNLSGLEGRWGWRSAPTQSWTVIQIEVHPRIHVLTLHWADHGPDLAQGKRRAEQIASYIVDAVNVVKERDYGSSSHD